MSFIPRPHEIYKHFKGNLYQVTAVAEHTETREQLVIYQALYGDFKTYARPLSMFTSRVDREKYPEASQEFRFELQGPDADRQRAEQAPAAESVNRAVFADPSDRGASAEPSDRAASAEAADRTGSAGSRNAVPDSEPAGMGANPERSPEEPSEGELALDPMVLEFLDADEYEHRLNILAGLHHRITDEMITTMAIACGVEIDEGDIEERYESLKKCLLMLERYESNRIR